MKHHKIICVNISDRPMRVLLRPYTLLSSGIMDILVRFEGVKYAILVISKVEDNIPNDLRRSVYSKSESKASSLIR